MVIQQYFHNIFKVMEKSGLLQETARIFYNDALFRPLAETVTSVPRVTMTVSWPLKRCI